MTNPEYDMNRPQAVVIGPSRDVTSDRLELADTFLEVMEERRDAIGHLGGEVEKTQEQIDNIRRIHEGTIALGRDLGINLVGRLPAINHYHFFPDQQTYDTAMTSIGNSKLGAKANSDLATGVHVVLQGDLNFDNSIIAHEGQHFIAFHRVAPVLHEQPDGSQSLGADLNQGYSPQSPALEESLCDFGGAEVLRRAGQKIVTFSYVTADLLIRALINETSKRSGVGTGEILGSLIRGRFTGEMTGLRLLFNAVGTEGVKILLGVTDYTNASDMATAATRMGLPETANDITNMDTSNLHLEVPRL